MATITTKVDDLDGKSEGAETIRISVGDQAIDIDLAPASLKKLEDVLKPYFDKGREVARKANASDTSKMRAWLIAHGHKLGEKGRIPEELQAIYHAANPS